MDQIDTESIVISDINDLEDIAEAGHRTKKIIVRNGVVIESDDGYLTISNTES